MNEIIISLDIETRNAPSTEVVRLMRDWEPPSNYKAADAIERARAKAEASAAEKLALLDSSPIACVCATVWSGGEPVSSAWVNPAYDERAQLTLAGFLNDIAGRPAGYRVTLVGANLLRFDLPKLRRYFLERHEELPEILRPGVRVHDVGRTCGDWSIEHRDYVSLETACLLWGVESPKGGMTGAEVPAALEAGRINEVVEYCIGDTQAALAVALRQMAAIDGRDWPGANHDEFEGVEI